MIKSKVLPIHSVHNKGKLATISHKNSNTRSAQDTRILADACRTDPSSIKIRARSQMDSITSNANSPVQFMTMVPFPAKNYEFNPPLPPKYRSPSRPTNRNYLSRRFLQRQLLQSYLDRVFKQMSLVRASEQKPLSTYLHKRSMTSTAR